MLPQWISLISGILILIHLFFGIAMVTQKLAVMDIAWGLGFVIMAWITAIQLDALHLSQMVLLGMVTLWGARLSGYLLLRSWGKPEDFRYLKLRKGWGTSWRFHSYFKVFEFQGLLLLICGSPLFWGLPHLSNDWSWVQTLGVVIWFFGFALESGADFYLARFKRNPAHRNQLCFQGPWKWCRFPNYLGEILLWWGVGIYVLNESTFWTLLSPLVLNLLIVKVSGIPLMEEKYAQRQDYQEYSRRVPRLIPRLWR